MQPSPAHDTAWHEARRKGIGGSDWMHVLSIPPYGCARQLFYVKTGFTPDRPLDEGTGPMKRGSLMEPLVVREFEEQTGMRTRRVNRVRRVDRILGLDTPDWLIGNLDRQIVSVGNGPGVLEAKTTNPYSFAKYEAEGVPEYWLAQPQHYLMLTGWSWAMLAVLEVVSWKLLVIPIAADHDLQRRLLEAGAEFWSRVETGREPERLAVKDDRCKDCPFQLSCLGPLAEIQSSRGKAGDGDAVRVDDPRLAGLVSQYKDVSDVEKDAKRRLDSLKSEIKVVLGDTAGRIKVDSGEIDRSFAFRESLDSPRLKTDMPAVWEQYSKTSVVETLRVK